MSSSFNRNVASKDSQLPGAFPSEDVITTTTSGTMAQEPTTTGAGQSSATGAWTSTGAADQNTADFTEDVKRLAAEAMTAATQVGLAARDTAVAVKEAAMPVAVDAAVAAKDATIPAANVASEKALNAATYTRDTAIQMSNTARENAPNVIPGTNKKNSTSGFETGFHHGDHLDETSTGIPTEVRDSILKSGQAPEAAGDWQAVQDKGKMEHELLASVRTTQAGPGDVARSQLGENQTNKVAKVLGATSGHGSVAHRPQLYSQDTGSYQEPGTAVVLGTDTERAFPLGMHTEPESNYPSTATSVPDFAETPIVTTGLETRETVERSRGAGRGSDYAHDTEAMSHAEDVGSGFASTDERVPRSAFALIEEPAGTTNTHEAPIVDKVPVRESEETTVGSGPGAYKTLGSGTPSGVRM